MTTTIQPTMHEGIFADENGNVYSNKRGNLRMLIPQKVNNTRSKKQYWHVGRYGLVHRVVASAYLGDVTGKVVNHLDGNPSNNRVSNLEIVTQRENHLHAISTGLAPLGENHGRSTYSDDQLLKALREVKQGSSVKSTARKFGVSQSYLNKVKNQRYRPYLWASLD